MGEQPAIEMFLPADPRWTRPYIRVERTDGLASWYCWGAERGGGWTQLNGPPVFDLRPVTNLDMDSLTRPADAGAGFGANDE